MIDPNGLAEHAHYDEEAETVTLPAHIYIQIEWHLALALGMVKRLIVMNEELLGEAPSGATGTAPASRARETAP